jgi:ABC-2 type transport system ATP-binding protein
MPSSTPAIEVKGMRKSFGGTIVLDGIDFTVEQGSVFSLLGPNGAGKTTVINILTTLLCADSGMATVNGFDVAKQGDRVRGSISLTGQFAAVDNLLTGRENLLLIGQLRHCPNPARTAQMLLEQFGLTEAADRRTLTYSGGMRRKLDIALGLIGDPAIMEADRLADDIGIISHGRIAARGTPRELKGVLPQGQIELRFAGPTQLARAAQVLGESRPARSDSALTLTVSTDGTIAQVKSLFALLERAELDVAEFSQKSPTLDDAFLRIIGNQKGAA